MNILIETKIENVETALKQMKNTIDKKINNFFKYNSEFETNKDIQDIYIWNKLNDKTVRKMKIGKWEYSSKNKKELDDWEEWLENELYQSQRKITQKEEIDAIKFKKRIKLLKKRIIKLDKLLSAIWEVKRVVWKKRITMLELIKKQRFLYYFEMFLPIDWRIIITQKNEKTITRNYNDSTLKQLALTYYNYEFTGVQLNNDLILELYITST